MSGEEGGRPTGGGVVWLELRAWAGEWAKDARKGRELLEAMRADLREVRRELHFLAVRAGVKMAASAREMREAGAGPATSTDSGGVVVPACRVCGCTWETIHDRDGPGYEETNVFVDADLCRRCRELGEDDETRRRERLHREAAVARDLAGQLILEDGEVRR